MKIILANGTNTGSKPKLTLQEVLETFVQNEMKPLDETSRFLRNLALAEQGKAWYQLRHRRKLKDPPPEKLASLGRLNTRWVPTEPRKLSSRRSGEQLVFIANHINKGVELIKQEKYSEAIEHFTSNKAAEASGIELSIKLIEHNKLPETIDLAIKQSDEWEGSYKAAYFIENDTIFLKIPIYSTEPKNEPQRKSQVLINKSIAYMLLEEWLHAAQSGFGSGISQAVKNIEKDIGTMEIYMDDETNQYGNFLEVLNDSGIHISSIELTQIIEKHLNGHISNDPETFLTRLSEVEKMRYNDLMEIDFVQFLIENNMPFDGNTLSNHNIRGKMLNIK